MSDAPSNLPFVMPDWDTLRKYVDEARIRTLQNLLAKAQDGTASASDYTVLLKVAKEVEELIPHSVLGEMQERSKELLETPEEEVMFGADDTYDPETPLDSFH